MELVFLGTGSAAPSTTRNVSSLALRFGSAVWLFDCGEATQHQLQKTALKLSRVQRIFLTHMHGDHLFGLPGLMCTLSAAKTASIPTAAVAASSSSSSTTVSSTEGGSESTLLELVGPPGLRQFIRTSLRLSHSNLSYPYVVHELHYVPEVSSVTENDREEEPFGSERLGKNLLPSDLRPPPSWVIPTELPGPPVIASAILHSVSTVGYVIQEPPSPGKLDVDAIKPYLDKNKAALQAQGVKNPMSLLAKVKNGEKVALPDGTVLDPASFVGPEKPGKKVAILGDTHDPSGIKDLVRDCDLLVHEATNAKLSSDVDKTFEEVELTAIDHGHSTPQMAGKFAREVGAKCLVLTHFSQRYKGDDEPESLATMEEIRQLAKKEFNKERAERGEADYDVIIAKDLATVAVK